MENTKQENFPQTLPQVLPGEVCPWHRGQRRLISQGLMAGPSYSESRDHTRVSVTGAPEVKLQPMLEKVPGGDPGCLRLELTVCVHSADGSVCMNVSAYCTWVCPHV